MQMVCVICVYGPHTGRRKAEKAFREEVERLVGLSDGDVRCGRFQCAHRHVVEPGDEESIGRFGWGTRNREGRELVEMLRRNGLTGGSSQKVCKCWTAYYILYKGATERTRSSKLPRAPELD